MSKNSPPSSAPERYAAALGEGKAMSLDEAVEYALASID